MTECNNIKEQRRHNTGLAKVAVQCSADPEVSGWLIKVWFSASIPKAFGMVKIATFAKPQNVIGNHPDVNYVQD
jgi:hypothetical protein